MEEETPATLRILDELRRLNRELEEQLEAQGRELEETREQLRTVFEHAPFSIQLIDRTGRTLQVNAAWRKLWEIPDDVVENYILRDYNVLIDPQLEEKGIAPLLRKALGGESQRLPTILYEPAAVGLKGRPRWVGASVWPVKNRAQQVTRLVLIHEDITEQKVSRETIIRQTAQFAAIFDHLPEPVVMTTAERMIALVNPAASKLFGYEPGELVGRPVSIIYASETNDEQQDQRPATFERLYRHKNGQTILSETTASLVRTPEGEVLGYVGIIRDVRERRRDEQMLQFMSQAGDVLSSSLEYNDTLSRLARLAVPTLGDWCLMDVVEDDGTVRRAEVAFANPQHEALKADIVRYAPRRTNLNHPPARALFESTPLLIPSVDRERIERLAQSDEHARVIAATGVRSMICVPLVARGTTIGVLTLMLAETPGSYTEKDLSYAKQLASKAAQAVENSRLYRRATDAISARDEFLGVCSHELKTPITSMKLQLQVAEQQSAKQDADEPLRAVSKRVTVAMKQLRRMEKLIDDMLDVSRIVTGRLTMQMEPLNARDVLNDVVEQMGDRFRAAGVEMTVSMEDDARVVGDRVRLAQIFDNLLSNALKYGGGKPVHVELARRSDNVVVSVRDRGPGIASEDLKRLFRRFERLEATKNVGGVGLGLYISREIAEAHHGTVEVVGSPGTELEFAL